MRGKEEGVSNAVEWGEREGEKRTLRALIKFPSLWRKMVRLSGETLTS